MREQKQTILAATIFICIALALSVVGFINRPGSVGVTDKLHGTYGAEGSDLNHRVYGHLSDGAGRGRHVATLSA